MLDQLKWTIAICGEAVVEYLCALAIALGIAILGAGLAGWAWNIIALFRASSGWELAVRIFGFFMPPVGPVVNGSYPSWRQLLAERPDEKIQIDEFDHRHLRCLTRALCGDTQGAAIRIVSTGRRGPHLVRSTNLMVNGFGLIMPMRADIQADYPKWMKPDVKDGPKSDEGIEAAPRTRWKRFLGLPIRLEP